MTAIIFGRTLLREKVILPTYDTQKNESHKSRCLCCCLKRKRDRR